MLKILYAPWRALYKKPETDCPFCKDFALYKQELFVLDITTTTVTLLNLYPYNAGHILVIPKKHVAHLDELTEQERNDLMQALSRSAQAVKTVLECTGINIGFNIGDGAAGGSVPHHIHGHVLPRWKSDTGFLTTLSHTKPISFNLSEIYQKLLPYFEQKTS